MFRRFLMWKKEKKKKKRGAIPSTYLLQNMSPRLHALQDILYTRCTVRGTVYVRRIHSYTMNAIFHMAFITQHMMQNILRLRCKNTTCAIIEISLASGHVVTIPAFTALRFIQRTRRVSSRDLDWCLGRWRVHFFVWLGGFPRSSRFPQKQCPAASINQRASADSVPQARLGLCFEQESGKKDDIIRGNMAFGYGNSKDDCVYLC